jgi:hypothetical protein
MRSSVSFVNPIDQCGTLLGLQEAIRIFSLNSGRMNVGIPRREACHAF